MKQTAFLIGSICCLVCIGLLVTVAVWKDGNSTEVNNAQTVVGVTDSSVKIETTLFTQEVSLVDESILLYMDESNTKSANEIYKQNKGYQRCLDSGITIKFSFAVTGLPAGVSVNKGRLEIAENSGYNGAQVFEISDKDQFVELKFLKTATKYYYRLTYTLSNGHTVGTIGTFQTQKSPRLLTVEGIRNMRDIGGWETLDGKTIKQGILYRGTELDGTVEKTYKLTEQGLKDMTETLGIVYDMDLRNARVNRDNPKDALGSGVKHQYYNFPDYTDIFNQDKNETVRTVFSDLSKKENYPMYVHCTYGRDRTGLVCYLLEGLLGVSEENAYKEYELSAFTDSYVSLENFEIFKKALDKHSGATFQEKIENYLRSIGVTATEIENIKHIFLQ